MSIPPNWGGKMTYDEFVSEVVTYRIATRQRQGQAYFNVLCENRPDLSEQIRGTPLDPFYKDFVPGDCIAFVKSRWDVRPTVEDEPPFPEMGHSNGAHSMGRS
jgi:hypothetical protein